MRYVTELTTHLEIDHHCEQLKREQICATSGDRNIFFEKKYLAISPRSGANGGERNLLLSASKGLC